MGSPIRAAKQQAGTGLVAAYIEYIGTREPDNISAIRDRSTSDLFRASLTIGASCVLLIRGCKEEADAALRQVGDDMQALIEKNGRHSSHGPSAAQLGLIARMLLGRNEADAAKQFQLQSHAENIADLIRLRPEYRRHGKEGSVAGILAEHALASLVTRYAGPGTLAVPALLHHDRHRPRIDSTDILVVNLGQNGQPANAERGQLKEKCLGFCDNQAAVAAGDMVRSGYMRDIVLVSGHCDIIDPGAGHSLNGLGRRLVLEAKNEASPAQIGILDEATLHVLQTITDPEAWRMGTRRMAQSVEYIPSKWHAGVA